MRAKFAIIAAVVLAACAPQSPDAPIAPDTPAPNADRPSPPAPPAVPDAVDIPQRIQDIDFTTYSRSVAQSVGLDIGEAKDAAKSKIQTYFQPQKGAEGNAEYNFVEYGGVGATVMLANASGLADDSVKAQELFAVFKNGMLVDYGMKIKCWRGETPDQWQTELCF